MVTVVVVTDKRGTFINYLKFMLLKFIFKK
jgi:hypothetical protein